MTLTPPSILFTCINIAFADLDPQIRPSKRYVYPFPPLVPPFEANFPLPPPNIPSSRRAMYGALWDSSYDSASQVHITTRPEALSLAPAFPRHYCSKPL